jgi:hypothetical protein
VEGKGAALRGTFGPGRHDVNFRYQIPLDGNAAQTLRVGLPPHVAQLRVIAEASKTMGLSVHGFPSSQRTQNREGKRVLVTEQQQGRRERPLTEAQITLTGLPTPGPGRTIAIVLALLAAASGVVYFATRREEESLDSEARDDLVEARETLLDEIVSLEKLRKKGEVGPKTYKRVRAALLDALSRVVDRLEVATQAAKRRRRDVREAARRSA